MVQPKGLLVEKAVHSLGCVGCGEESWWIGTTVGVWNLGWGCCAWRVDSQRVISPYEIIALARGWIFVERKLTAAPMAGRFILCTQLVG